MSETFYESFMKGFFYKVLWKSRKSISTIREVILGVAMMAFFVVDNFVLLFQLDILKNNGKLMVNWKIAQTIFKGI